VTQEEFVILLCESTSGDVIKIQGYDPYSGGSNRYKTIFFFYFFIQNIILLFSH
jgi:hypothetical protein